MSNNILVLFAHPAIHQSSVNRRLIKVYKEFKNITFRDLYDTYPEFMIDVEHEQQLLLQHDIIIFHHPIYWYSGPPILKQWMDLVLRNEFAYGQGGNALQGKKLLSTISTGQAQSAYSEQGDHRYTVREFLYPFEQTARFCGMSYLPPFVVHCATNRFDQARIVEYMSQYRLVLAALSNQAFDSTELMSQEYINSEMSLFDSYRQDHADAFG